MRWVCDACKRAFEADEGRCPKCLRITTVRDADAPPPDSAAGPDDVARDRFHTAARLTFLGASIAISVPWIVVVLWMDKALGPFYWPLMFAAWAFAATSLRVPRALPDEAYEGGWARAFRHWVVTIGTVAIIAVAVAFGGSVAAFMLEPFGLVVQVIVGGLVALGLLVVLFKLVLTPERRRAVDRWTDSRTPPGARDEQRGRAGEGDRADSSVARERGE